MCHACVVSGRFGWCVATDLTAASTNHDNLLRRNTASGGGGVDVITVRRSWCLLIVIDILILQCDLSFVIESIRDTGCSGGTHSDTRTVQQGTITIHDEQKEGGWEDGLV